MLTIPFVATAQLSEPKIKTVKSEKYLYPVNPGRPGSLAGNMGELRSTHFHSGIDVRTNNMVGMPVLASKDGYISRITMTTGGYGNVIYIKHPDGNTTLYAHLNEFKGSLGKHVLQERYAKKTSEIDLVFEKDQFKIKQGDTIALSGNTGGSGGPHLHFDIRDSSFLALDPLTFGFSEIVDSYPPAAEKIALVTLDINARINDRFGRFEFYAQKVGKNYILSQPIFASGNIGVEILAKDKLAYKSAFYGGVKSLEMMLNNKLVFSQTIDKINVTESRDIYTLMNFKTMRTKGTRFYKLYIDDGNTLQFYKNSPGSGKINIRGDKDEFVKINMKDSYGNTNNVSFTLRPVGTEKQVKTLEPMKTDIFSDVNENILMVTAKPCRDSINKAMYYINGVAHEKTPEYYNISRSVYLFDLRKEIPDSVVVCESSTIPKITARISPGISYSYSSEHIDLTFPENALYDTLYLNTDYYHKNGSEIFTIGQRIYPLNKSINISLKPKKEYPPEQKYSAYRVSGGDYSFVGGEWVNGILNFSTRELGDYTILRDTDAPVIKPIYLNNLMVRFRIRDSLSGINSFEANINGNWLLMNYDYKTGIIFSEKLDNKIPLRGDFELVVTDNAGNKQTYKHKIL